VLRARVLAVALAASAVACGKPSFDRREKEPGGGSGEVCGRASDCRTGLVCVSRRCAVTLPAGACQPPGSPVIVLGEVAGPSMKPDPLPVPPCAQPVQPAVTAGPVQELGEHGVGDSVGFEVPPGTAGFTIVSQEVAGSAVDAVTVGDGSLPNSVFPLRILRPDGASFYESSASPPSTGGYPDYTQVLAFYFGVTSSSGSMTVPNTTPALDLVRSEGQLPSGTWSFTLTDFARECRQLSGCSGGSTTGRYDVKVLTRPGHLAATGTLDLDVYLVSSDHPEYTAAAATADPTSSRTAAQFHRLVDGLARLFARAGICLGTVVFHDVPDWARTELSALDIDAEGPCNDLSRLFRLAVPRDSVHLFLVDELLTTQGSTTSMVVGLDGSIPGPSGVPGGINSGAAVVLADLGFAPDALPNTCDPGQPFRPGVCGTDSVAYISGHEAGHWLGLYHPTESGGTDFDPLADTATCPCNACGGALTSRCGNGAELPASSCSGATASCAGADNLMFWQIDPAYARGTLSPQQGEVMRLNPAVR
jgi:hypothetical protein